MKTELLQHSRIMVIDDEEANLKLMRKVLERAGYDNLELVQDPRLVMEAYHRNPPDLILLDLNMPHIDGFEMLRQFQALEDPLSPPVVVLTAQSGRSFLLQSLQLGARDFLSKPFDPGEVLMRVANLLQAQLAHRLVRNQKDVLEAMVRQRTEELSRTRLQVVQRLGRAAEYRDNETGLHIIRMSQFSVALARSLGWDAAAQELLLNASPMHDIGKIGIPDHILLKPGKFEPEEWEIMKNHAAIGAEILSGDDSALLRLAEEIAQHHHEKWDGSGYPAGLKGQEIPQSARIVALADVFDALLSNRPYKKSWTVEEAVEFIRSQSGRHFDPEVVAHFEQCLPELLDIRAKYHEP